MQFPARYYPLLTAAPGSLLLQTSRFDQDNFRSYLFLHPARVLCAQDAGQIPALFQEAQRMVAEGAFVAGFVSYECDRTRARAGLPLAWFGVYPQAFIFDHRCGRFDGPSPDSLLSSTPAETQDDFELRTPRFDMEVEEYSAKIDAIKEFIRSGDTYQVNLTGDIEFDFCGSATSLFRELGARQSVSYSAFLHHDDCDILCLSPELFFRLRNRHIVTQPMKGTARRGADLTEDEAVARWLHCDVKSRAENVMIVDLLRNDLGRICTFGSIRVEELFTVEKYETLFQMTSKICGDLRSEVDYAGIFESLFPCGSVTGAPKLRTMKIIRQLERRFRGIYTGSIGFFSPSGEAVFNVAIRTLVLRGEQGVMGVGSGILADSTADDEYRECLLKAEFLTAREVPFQLIESLLWNGVYPLLALHRERLESSAAYFGFKFDPDAFGAALQGAADRLQDGARYKIRVVLDRCGAISVDSSPLEEWAGTVKVIVSPRRVSSRDRFLRHKTTRRRLYDEEYTRARLQGWDEVLFVNERDEVTEGAISNLFVQQGERLYTPPVACGLLPGTYRRYVLENHRNASEKVLSLNALASADALYICNAVRGMRKAELVAAP